MKSNICVVKKGGLGLDSGNMVQTSFQITFGKLFGATAGNIIGSIFVAVCLFFFAFSTIISWNFFGKVNFGYLFGKKALIIYSVLSIGCVFLGSIGSNDLVWGLSDLFNNLMVIPNVLALFALGSMVYERFQKKDRICVEGKVTSKEE